MMLVIGVNNFFFSKERRSIDHIALLLVFQGYRSARKAGRLKMPAAFALGYVFIRW